MSENTKLSNDVEVTSSSPNDKRMKKSWGFIVAYPHEYLIHFREGRLNDKTSGQGARCFKRPTDTVFIIPTSLKEIVFEANQLSKDNVDVRIRGMAIYRISNPLQIYTQLNFSNRQQAEEKLARMIGDLCRSTAKWLVANMGMEECLRKRKEEIATTLKLEVTQVVTNADKNWGVEIVTVDIKDVYIQDKEIFGAMQILFKTEKLRESQLSQMRLEQDIEIKKLQQEIELEKHRKNKEIESARIAAEIKAEQIKLTQENDIAQFALDHYRVEQNEAISQYKAAQEVERQRLKIQIVAEENTAKLEAQRLVQELDIDVLRRKMEIENTATPFSLEKNFIETALPMIAEAVAKSMSHSRVHIIQGGNEGGTPFKFVLVELLEILRERMERIKNTKQDPDSEK